MCADLPYFVTPTLVETITIGYTVERFVSLASILRLLLIMTMDWRRFSDYDLYLKKSRFPPTRFMD